MTTHKDINIATIVSCRLKSSRLARKALLKIGDLSSIEYCIKNTLTFKASKFTVLATSTVEEDAELEQHTYLPEVRFYRGSPEDVMQRYVDVVDQYDIDVFIRVTGDMPFVSNDILDIILKSHLEQEADYSAGQKATIGTNLEVINSGALRKAKSHFLNASYSEYMTYYFTNNPEYFKLNFVPLPKKFIRDFRLTLDYEQDLRLFNIIHDYLKQHHLDPTLDNIFTFLDNNPDIARINQNLMVKYLNDSELVETLKRVTKIK